MSTRADVAAAMTLTRYALDVLAAGGIPVFSAQEANDTDPTPVYDRLNFDLMMAAVERAFDEVPS